MKMYGTAAVLTAWAIFSLVTGAEARAFWLTLVAVAVIVQTKAVYEKCESLWEKYKEWKRTSEST